MDNQEYNSIVSFIWGIADDCLRDVYVRGKYRDVILPMTVIRRLDAMLEDTKTDVLEMKKKLDFNEVGGTALLGISKPVIKAHGASKAPAIANAVRQAVAFAQTGIIDDITANIDAMKIGAEAGGEG